MVKFGKEIAIVLAIVVFAMPAKSQIDTISLSFSSRAFLLSEILGEKVEAWIRVPSNFEEVKDLTEDWQ